MTTFTDYLEFWSAGLLVLFGLTCVVAFISGLIWFFRRAVEEAELRQVSRSEYERWHENERRYTCTDEDKFC